jgi:hypothetical protein
MKKGLCFLLLAAFTFFILGAAYVYFNQASYVSGKVSNLFGTAAEIENVRWTRNGIIFEDVVLYNPTDCTIQTAFSVKEIEVVMSWKELFAALLGNRVAQIDKIYIRKPLFGIEFFNTTGSDSNWKRLLDNGVTNYKQSRDTRSFRVEEIVLTDVELQFLNKAVSLEITHPDSIREIQMGQVASALPTSVYRIMHTSAKISLFQIATALQQPEFRDSINDVPILPLPQ